MYHSSYFFKRLRLDPYGRIAFVGLDQGTDGLERSDGRVPAPRTEKCIWYVSDQSLTQNWRTAANAHLTDTDKNRREKKKLIITAGPFQRDGVEG